MISWPTGTRAMRLCPVRGVVEEAVEDRPLATLDVHFQQVHEGVPQPMHDVIKLLVERVDLGRPTPSAHSSLMKAYTSALLRRHCAQEFWAQVVVG